MTTAALTPYISQQTLAFQIQRLELYYGVNFLSVSRNSNSYAGKQLVEGAGVIIKKMNHSLTLFRHQQHSGLLNRYSGLPP